ncbi:MAG: peroxidase-related enzyme [Vicingaceae bacterium]|nr:peroxidase-related enzyme [Vicingaceae bacterium]
MSKIKVIQPEEAEGRLLEIYTDLIAKRGKLAEVHKIQSLRPESIVKHMDLYLEIMFSKSDLTRAEREMMAVVVSASNNCFYCQIHHAEALNNYWKDKEKVEKFRLNYVSVNLSERELALCEYAKQLTLFPSEDIGLVEKLKTIGLSDKLILDATLVIAYFNFVNRMVLGLGVNLEENASGYNY